jgi:Flp pilus assembly protein TadG
VSGLPGYRLLGSTLPPLRRCAAAQVGAQQSGQAVVWVAMMLPLLLSIVGVTADGGMVFNARLELQNAVDGAARAGAMQIDERLYRQSAGSNVALDTGRAEDAARAYLATQRTQRLPLTATVEAQPRRVVVQARQEIPTTFLRVVGLDRVPVAAIGVAEVRHGVERGEP